MPTYDYKCKTCGEVFEHVQSMKDDPLSHCLCGKQGVVDRLITGSTGIIFKGSGFYVTDYKKAKPKEGKSTEAAAAAPATPSAGSAGGTSTTASETSGAG